MLVRGLKEVKKGDSVTSSKIIDIAELYSAGFPVPYGFCVTSEAHRVFLEETKIIDIISEAISNSEDIPKIAESIKRLIVETEIPEEIKTTIKNAYDSLDIDKDIYKYASKAALEFVKAGRSWPYVAIRNSPLHYENKNAFLNIKSIKDILNTIKICWASMFTVGALTQLKKDLDYEKVLTTILVQKMVNSEKSGVMLSKDQEIIVEAFFGSGEILSEGTKPDQYIIDKNLKIKIISENEQELVYIREENLGKIVKRRLPKELIGKRVLDSNELKYLAKCLMGIEKYYNSPRIVEWASEAGRFFILGVKEPTKETIQNQDQLQEVNQNQLQEAPYAIEELSLLKLNQKQTSIELALEIIKAVKSQRNVIVKLSDNIETFRQECKAVKIALEEVKSLGVVLPSNAPEYLETLKEEGFVPSENFRILVNQSQF